MGFAFEGKCYPDKETALQAFIMSVPKFDGTAVNHFNAQPTISQSGVIDWVIVNRPLNTATATSRIGTLGLPQCVYQSDNKFDLVSVQDILIAVGMITAFCFGVLVSRFR